MNPKKRQNFIEAQIREHLALQEKILTDFPEQISRVADAFLTALRQGGKILFCGNGGSAADAQHLAAELVVRLRGHVNRPAIPAMALTVDSSILTAAGNDFGFEMIFARQIEALGTSRDVLVAISTSGNSPNVVKAVEQARKAGLKTIGMLGGDGGKLKELLELPLIVPSPVTARIQETHIMMGHIICQIVEEELFS